MTLRSTRRSPVPGRSLNWLLLLLAVAVPLGTRLQAQDEVSPAEVSPPTAAEADEDSPVKVKAGLLVLPTSTADPCFSSSFLEAVDRETSIAVERKLTPVTFEHALADYPFLVVTGGGAFTLTAEQVVALRRYIEGGGFLVASAGCSNRAWAESFRAAVGRIRPGRRLVRLPMSHAVFHTLYEIDELVTRRPLGEPVALEGLTHEGRLAVVFAAHGLNDTDHAGGNCCCCGGNELRNAALINANLLVYALTH